MCSFLQPCPTKEWLCAGSLGNLRLYFLDRGFLKMSRGWREVPVACGDEQVLSVITPLCSASCTCFTKWHITFPSIKGDTLELSLNSLHSVRICSLFRWTKKARRVGGCSVLIGFADINKSRTCARPLGLTPEIDASLMGVSFSRRPREGNRGAIVWSRESQCSPHLSADSREP